LSFQQPIQSFEIAVVILRAPTNRLSDKPMGAAGKGERSNATKSKSRPAAAKPALLAGGNPQIAKADGDAPVQAYIAVMPGWKRDCGRRLDALIVRNVPNLRKDARWIDIHEDDLDEAQMATWIKQASSIPGWETGNGSLRRRT
jgi:hypothetical protein